MNRWFKDLVISWLRPEFPADTGPSWFSVTNGEADWGRIAGDVWTSSAVSIALRWISDNFPEPDLEVAQKNREGDWEAIPEHPLVKLLDNPNPEYDFYALWGATLTSFLVDGNAFWIKASSGAGVQELWYVPHWEMEPKGTKTEFITHYERTIDGVKKEVPKDQVVHFRDVIDPRNIRKGRGRLTPVLSSVCTDKEADFYTYYILRNSGTPSVVLGPKDEKGRIEKPQREDIKETWQAAFGRKGRGGLMVAGVPFLLQVLGFSPEQMVLDKLRTLPEDRICAATGLNAQALNLTSGTSAKTYANQSQATESAYNSCLIPLQSRMAETLYREFPELVDRRHRVMWNYSRVRALQKEDPELLTRLANAFEKNLLSRAQCLLELGKTPTPEDEVYAYQLASPAPNPLALPAPPSGNGNGKMAGYFQRSGQGTPGGRERLRLTDGRTDSERVNHVVQGAI